MPTYDYECKHCKQVFELFHSISDDTQKKCEKCGNVMKRLIGSGCGVIFKGSGFYETDYKRKQNSGGSKSSDNNKPMCGGNGSKACSDCHRNT